jgi:hypothetical protein
MKTKFNYLIIILCFVIVDFKSYSATVSVEKAKNIAVNFYNMQYYKANGSLPNYKAITISPLAIKRNSDFWVCSFSKGGFVIVSGDDNAYPIIGYSFNSIFDLENIPPQLKDWLTSASLSIENAKHLKRNNSYNYLWEKLLNKNEVNNMQKQSLLNVNPLLTTKWDQGENYNNYCPVSIYGPGGHCVTGCVATAMAQVMKFHNYPEVGQDSMYYNSVYEVFQNTYYRWSEMTTQANTTSGDAISKLIFHCGITVNMNYGPTESGTSTSYVPNALINYFKYHPSADFVQRENFTDKNWDVLIRDNLDLTQPVLYSGYGSGGHAFVCDGYQDTCYYHFNWGWSGYGDGYYFYNNLSPAGNDFSSYQGAVISIKPFNTPYCIDGRILTDRYRTFNDGSGVNLYAKNTSCNWLISPDSAASIKLTFTTFQTQLNTDFVSVYNGADATAPLIGKYSGNQIPQVITSSGSKLYVVFTSDGATQAQGFEAHYETTIIGINETFLNNNLSFYPNPAKDLLFVKHSDIINWDGEIEIYDLTGKLVKNNKVNISSENIVTINVSDLQKGFYILTAKGKEGECSTKLIIQ